MLDETFHCYEFLFTTQNSGLKFWFWKNRSSEQGEMVVIIFDIAFKGTEDIYLRINVVCITTLSLFSPMNLLKMCLKWAQSQRFWDNWFLKCESVLHLKFSRGRVPSYLEHPGFDGTWFLTGTHLTSSQPSWHMFLQTQSLLRCSSDSMDVRPFLTSTCHPQTLHETARAKYLPPSVMNSYTEQATLGMLCKRWSRNSTQEPTGSQQGSQYMPLNVGSREPISRSQPLEPERPGFDFRLWHRFTTWNNYLAFPSFCFPIYKVWIIISPISQDSGKNTMKQFYEVTSA